MALNNQSQVQPQIQYSAPVLYYTVPANTYQPAGTKNFGQHYERHVSTGLGATQVVLACISIAAGAMGVVYYTEFGYVGIGIWGGAFYLATGSVAIAAGHEPTNNLIKATLVCSIFCILLGIAQVTTSAFGVENFYWVWEEALAADALMVAVGSLEIIFGTWLVAVSATAISKGSKAQPVNIPVTYAPQHQPEAVFIQAPSNFQPQPPMYYAQQQYPSTSGQQQMMFVSAQQAPPMTIRF